MFRLLNSYFYIISILSFTSSIFLKINMKEIPLGKVDEFQQSYVTIMGEKHMI